MSAVQVNLGNTRGYRPSIPLKNYDVKLLKVGLMGRRRSTRATLAVEH